ncbi:MAG TPA: hypothetical protein PLW93_02395 [Candidatus Absconditabacterales bacterium]|nr:hypothetical protein [Candidatus Absconditabacterales bacterium]HNG97098.1 hypothetical protein [Candidatus Absconditabacterales bacterium]
MDNKFRSSILTWFVGGFLCLVAGYFLLHTIIVYGLFDGRHQMIVSFSKDIIRCAIVLIAFIVNPRQSLVYIRQTLWSWIFLIIMAILGIVVTWYRVTDIHTWITNTMVGLKYGWYVLVVVRSAGLVGHVIWSAYSDMNSEKKENIQKLWMSRLVTGAWIVLLGGCIVQGSKIIFPDLWMSLGFGPLDVYKPGVAPPLYYLTKHDGIIRYSGLFSGPNNFAFWLVSMTPILRSWTYRTTIKQWFARVGLGVFGVINIGRLILVSWLGEGILNLLFVGNSGGSPKLLHSRQGTRKNILFWIGIGVVMVTVLSLVGWVTYIKRESTYHHFFQGIQALARIWDNPWGYGLGSSGPGVHRNGSLLPENYYLQLLLDYGIGGLICFIVFWITRLRAISMSIYHRWFLVGFGGLLIGGLFLHVFEDSMVNYLFFVPRGMMINIKE